MSSSLTGYTADLTFRLQVLFEHGSKSDSCGAGTPSSDVTSGLRWVRGTMDRRVEYHPCCWRDGWIMAMSWIGCGMLD